MHNKTHEEIFFKFKALFTKIAIVEIKVTQLNIFTT